MDRSLVALIRRYCDEFINSQNPDVCAELMVDGYLQRFAGHVFDDRSVYEPLVKDLFDKFPDLRITSHEVLTDGEQVATRFTLQGSSTRHGGNQAAWGGVALYRWNGTKLTECWVEEDQHSGRRQLRTGVLEIPEQPAGPEDPWAARVAAAAPGATEAATRWLTAGGDGRLGTPVTVDALLVAGNRFAFHTSSPTILVAGMATVDPDGSVDAVTTFTDGGNP